MATGMAKAYYKLVKAGTRKITEIPEIWRDEVQWLLDEDNAQRDNRETQPEAEG